MMYSISPSRGVLVEAVGKIVEDAPFLGLSPSHAVDRIINKKNGWFDGDIGYIWMWFALDEEEYINLKYSAGHKSKWNKNGGKAIYFNGAIDEIENIGALSFLEKAFGIDDDSIFNEDSDIMLKAGVIPYQKILIRGEYWASRDYWGEFDSGFDAEIIFIEEKKYKLNDFCKMVVGWT